MCMPTAPPAAPRTPTPPVSREELQPGRIVTLKSGERRRIVGVNPDGSFQTEPVR